MCMEDFFPAALCPFEKFISVVVQYISFECTKRDSEVSFFWGIWHIPYHESNPALISFSTEKSATWPLIDRNLLKSWHGHRILAPIVASNPTVRRLHVPDPYRSGDAVT